jgi:hypothetical protein
MKVEVYKCPDTGRLFETKEKYDKHRKKLGSENFRKGKVVHKVDLNTFRLTATSIQDFRDKVFSYIDSLQGPTRNKLVDLQFESLRFGNVGISHSAPIGTRTRWGTNETALGWGGEIKLVFEGGGSHDVWRQIPGINTGSGGGGINDARYFLRYDLRLYLDDFPLIKERYEDYIRIGYKRQEFDLKVITMCKEAEDSDKKLQSLIAQEEDLTAKIEELTNTRNKVSLQGYKISQLIKEKINSENQFTDLKEYNQLKSELYI